MTAIEHQHAAQLAEYLSGFDWSHFLTLTSKKQHPEAALRREFEEGFIRRLAKQAGAPIPFFRVIEGGTVPGSLPHLHAFIAGARRLTTTAIGSAWRLGFTRVKVYDPTRGAARYLAKGIPLAPDSYDFSRRHPVRLLRLNSAR